MIDRYVPYGYTVNGLTYVNGYKQVTVISEAYGIWSITLDILKVTYIYIYT